MDETGHTGVRWLRCWEDWGSVLLKEEKEEGFTNWESRNVGTLLYYSTNNGGGPFILF